LLTYALTEESERALVLKELAEEAEITGINEINEIKICADKLLEPDTIRHIIEDYEQASGEFSLAVSDEQTYQKLFNRATELGLQELIKNRIKIDEDQSTHLSFSMKNTIQFFMGVVNT